MTLNSVSSDDAESEERRTFLQMLVVVGLGFELDLLDLRDLDLDLSLTINSQHGPIQSKVPIYLDGLSI